VPMRNWKKLSNYATCNFNFSLRCIGTTIAFYKGPQ
jgi:hypothetical protein